MTAEAEGGRVSGGNGTTGHGRTVYGIVTDTHNQNIRPVQRVVITSSEGGLRIALLDMDHNEGAIITLEVQADGLPVLAVFDHTWGHGVDDDEARFSETLNLYPAIP